MIAASFAYVLAYQLHLKRLANQKLQEELDGQEQKQEELKRLLRSLLEEEFVQDMAAAAADEIATETETTTGKSWSWASSPNAKSSTPLDQSQTDAIAQLLRQKLEERIGDEGLDDEIKKERGIERVWKQNQQQVESDDDDKEEDIAGLLALAQEAALDESATKNSRQKRVID
ncbi:MAG: hypothetical protein SGARI_007247, partial [Bacillariaceae sp.]